MPSKQWVVGSNPASSIKKRLPVKGAFFVGKTLFLEHLVQCRAQVVHVRVVQRLVAVERPVFLNKVDNGDVSCTVRRAELAFGVLEDRNDRMELVDEQADVVFLDSAAKPDGDTGESVALIFLHQVLDDGEVVLAVRALGAEVVDEKGTVAEMAEEDAGIADTRERFRKVHLHGLVRGRILHQLDVGHLGLRCKLGKRNPYGC